MSIWGCDSPARCCQPAVAGGFIYADLRGELHTHLAQQALFTRVLLCTTATATSFPLSKHTGGGGSAPGFSGLHVYLVFTWEVTLPPPPVEFSSTTTYKVSCSWLLDVCRCSFISGWLVYLQFHEGLPLPPLRHSRCPTLFAMCLFYCYCLLFSLFFSFFPGWALVCPGGYAELAPGCLWEYCVLLSSPGGLLLSRRLGAGVWWCESPLVSPFNMKWGCYAWAGGVVVLVFYLFLVFSSISPRF
jgi:hypothetical protein